MLFVTRSRVAIVVLIISVASQFLSTVVTAETELFLSQFENEETIQGSNHYNLRSTTTIKSAPSNHRRKLTKKSSKKSRQSDSENAQRVVVNCDPDMSQENCIELLSLSGESITIVHNLPGIHSVAIEVDASTREDLVQMGMDVVEDTVREPLDLPDSFQDHRELVDEPQEMPYGVVMISTVNMTSFNGRISTYSAHLGRTQ